jgi:hypothetical protein
MRFSSEKAGRYSSSRVHGFVQLPGESEMRMVRMALAPNGALQGLLGQWMMRFSDDATAQESKSVNLVQITGDEAINEDGSIRCKQLVWDYSVKVRVYCA